MANKTLQLLRNSAIAASHEAALTALTTALADHQAAGKVGEPVLMRYYEGEGASKQERIILGIVGSESYEIFDNLAPSDATIAAIEALDAEITSSDGTNVQVKVTEVDGKVTAVNIATDNTINNSDLTSAIQALDSEIAATAEANNQISVLTGVTEVDGKLTAKTEALLAAVAKTGAAEDVSNTAIAAGNDTVAIAGTNVKTQIENIGKAIKSAENAATAAINALDAEVTSTDGTNVQVKVTEVDGKVTAVNVTTDNSINATDLDNKVATLTGDATATAADGNKYSVLTGVSESNGIISKTSEVKLEAVAKTGAAADVSIADSGDYFTATTVEAALAELATFDAGTY